MNIQEAAELSGLPADTIRFYERQGVLPRPPRRRNGYREYGEEHLVTLRLASALRGLEVPLERLAGVLRVAHDGTCHELRDKMLDTLSNLVDEIDKRAEELQETREELNRILGGLETMEPDDERLPGVNRCACVDLANPEAIGQ